MAIKKHGTHKNVFPNSCAKEQQEGNKTKK